MKTILDELYTSFLDALTYSGGELRIVVAEGFRAAEPEDVLIAGHLIKDTYALAVSEHSRRVAVRFSHPIAWQLVDESFTAADDYEVRESEQALQVLTRSRYLDYVCQHHGWFDAVRGPAKHYRVWTENEVVDVVACEPPEIDLAAVAAESSAYTQIS